ncbi:MAG TPA: precorrin-8X methylmutase [Pseudonocardiaceae bacterium]
MRDVHPIEEESYRILHSRIDTNFLPQLMRAVVERVVHATADTSWVGDLVADEAGLEAGRQALLVGAPLVVDSRMVAAGVTTRGSVVALDLPGVAELAEERKITRSAAGIRLAAQQYPDGAVWAIGNAPTALNELVNLAMAGELRPVLVIGVPVGFVGSVLAGARLRAIRLPALSTRTERGGATVAAAAINALMYYDEDET